MENVIKSDTSHATEAEKNLKRDFFKTADTVSQSTHELASSGKKVMSDIQTFCCENPGKAIGIAAGVGTLMGVLLVKAFSRRQSPTERILSNLFRSGEDTWNHVKSGFSPGVKKIKEAMGQ